jgi:hypothetical protein
MLKDLRRESVGGGGRRRRGQRGEWEEKSREEEDVEITYKSTTGKDKGRGDPEEEREIAGSVRVCRCRRR